MLEDMVSRIERSPRRTFVDPGASWCAREGRERPIGGRLELPAGALVAAAVASLVLLAPWLV
ncbi:MAG TPA: hypothetical protein VGL23_24740 [Chloroflexota bacterium]|jgi:hypothetical protein